MAHVSLTPWAVRLLTIPAATFVSGEACTDERVSIVGATGYIGKAVVRESIRRGYSTTAVVRDMAKALSEPKFDGAALVQADVCDPTSLAACPAFQKGSVDVVISCLASRTGEPLATLECSTAEQWLTRARIRYQVRCLRHRLPGNAQLH